MKKLILSFCAFVLALSVISCKNNSTDKTTEADEVYKTPAEVFETPVVEEIDTTLIDSTLVDSTDVEKLIID